jgi:sec-independent protein translocase protein TatA
LNKFNPLGLEGGFIMQFGPTELLIILVIVILLFGVGRVSKIGGEMGSAVANFRKGMSEATKEQAKSGEQG